MLPRALPLLPFFLLLLGCSHGRNTSEFPAVAEDFVYRTLAFSPVNATSQGLHKYEGRDLDTELDDFSGSSFQRQRDYYVSTHKKLAEFDRARLSPEDRADLDIIDSRIALALFEIDIARTSRRNPTTYVETIGNALFTPYILEYAPKPDRFRHIIARLNKIPDFLRIAQRQLFAAPQPWIKVAIEENQGNLSLIDKTLTENCPAELKSDFQTAARAATDSLRLFQTFLQNDLPKRVRRRDNDADSDPSDWRLGPDSYATKFKLALGTDRSPDDVLKDAQERLKQVRAQMLSIAKPLHKEAFPTHGDHSDVAGEQLENTVISEELSHIAEKHSTPATYMDDAKIDLTEAREFVQSHHLLTLPSRDNLQVIPTPEFMRGIYAVGGFSPAPVLEPQLGAFYWITPIPSDWPKARIESKLREYNLFNLKLLTIHEAMPGHYVQAEIANDVQPRPRRILRALYGNDPYVEGWAQYATQVMLDSGFLDNAPELRLTLLKQELRVIANAIIDIQFQSRRMTEQQAIELMEKQTFQETEEATAKIQRAQLSSAQLPTYFVGWRDWLRVREAVRKKEGSGFNQAAFHDRALREGAVPLPVLETLLTGK